MFWVSLQSLELIEQNFSIEEINRKAFFFFFPQENFYLKAMKMENYPPFNHNVILFYFWQKNKINSNLKVIKNEKKLKNDIEDDSRRPWPLIVNYTERFIQMNGKRVLVQWCVKLEVFFFFIKAKFSTIKAAGSKVISKL